MHDDVPDTGKCTLLPNLLVTHACAFIYTEYYNANNDIADSSHPLTAACLIVYLNFKSKYILSHDIKY